MSDYLEEPKNPGLDDGRCALCKKPGLNEDDHRCHGCGYLICEDCDVTGVMGPHLVTEHEEKLI